MRKNKLIAFVTILCLVITCTVGCGRTNSHNSTKIYYLSSDKSCLVVKDFEFSTVTVADRIQEAVDALEEVTGNVEYMQPIPAGVTIEEWDISDGVVSIYFNSVYSELEPLTEVLVRSAIVKTLVQIVGVSAVSFYVDNKPLENAQGIALGAQTGEMFIEDFGQETDSLMNTTLKLYFASADGATLVPEKRSVYYSSNVALEKLIIDQLFKGPRNSSLLSAIPAETKLISVSVIDGICYVNFDAAFETTIIGVSEKATIYSVVNSLTELNTITQVQIMVAGEVPHLANVDVDLSQPLVKNYEIINEVVDDDDYYDESLNPIQYIDDDTSTAVEASENTVATDVMTYTKKEQVEVSDDTQDTQDIQETQETQEAQVVEETPDP